MFMLVLKAMLQEKGKLLEGAVLLMMAVSKEKCCSVAPRLFVSLMRLRRKICPEIKEKQLYMGCEGGK